MSKKGDERARRKADKQKKREAKIASEPRVSRQPKVAPHDDATRAHVLWCFSQFDGIDWRKDPSVAEMSFCDVASKMRSYSRRTWGEIVADSKRDHSAEPGQLSPDAQKRLKDIGLDDVGELFRFRFSGTERLWGFRDRAFFIVLWWDPDHAIWPVEKE